MREPARRQHAHRHVLYALPARDCDGGRRNGDRRRRPYLHRFRRRLLRRPLRPFASGDPRGGAGDAGWRHGLWRDQPLRGAACGARLRALPLHRAGALHHLGHRGQHAGAGHRPRGNRQGQGHGVRGRLSRRHHLFRPRERADQRALPLPDCALQRPGGSAAPDPGECPPPRRGPGRAASGRVRRDSGFGRLSRGVAGSMQRPRRRC